MLSMCTLVNTFPVSFCKAVRSWIEGSSIWVVISEKRSDKKILQKRESGEKGVYPSFHKQSLFLDSAAEGRSLQQLLTSEVIGFLLSCFVGILGHCFVKLACVLAAGHFIKCLIGTTRSVSTQHLFMFSWVLKNEYGKKSKLQVKDLTFKVTLRGRIIVVHKYCV